MITKILYGEKSVQCVTFTNEVTSFRKQLGSFECRRRKNFQFLVSFKLENLRRPGLTPRQNCYINVSFLKTGNLIVN